VKPFPSTDLIGKPLVAFEALPARTALPSTWDSGHSRWALPAQTALPSTWGSGHSGSPVHAPDMAAEAS
jgi:hypothetical protein